MGVPVLNLRNQADVALHREVGEQAYFLNDVADHAAEADYVPFAGGTGVDEKFAVGWALADG